MLSCGTGRLVPGKFLFPAPVQYRHSVGLWPVLRC